MLRNDAPRSASARRAPQRARLFLALALLVPACSEASAGQATERSPAAPRRPAAASRVASVEPPPPVERVMIIGDSGMFDAAPAIGAMYRADGASDIVDVTFPGFSLTRDPVAWQTSWGELLRTRPPDLTVSMMGGWDAAFLRASGPQRYDELLEAMADLVTAGGGRLLVLGIMPGDAPMSAELEAVRERYRALAARRPSTVRYDEIDDALRSDDGTIGRWIRNGAHPPVLARKPDGWHLCPDGAIAIARSVGKITGRAGWTPPPTTGWERASWRAEQRYDNPPGGCHIVA